MRRLHELLISASLAITAIALTACTTTVKVVPPEEPKGGCLYHCEPKACCASSVTEQWCAQRGGSWSPGLKECPD